ncbi:beta-ketoacyl-ACP synthase III [Actinokineospora soli]
MGAVMGRAAVLTGIGSALPDRVVTNDELATRMDTSDQWIRSRTGIGERRVVEPGTATSDLAVDAGARVLVSAGVDRVDVLVLATTTPDQPCPATAPAVASRLDLGPIPAHDVAAVCSGFLYGLASAAGLIAAGLADRVLMIGAEAFTTIIDPTDRTTAPIFGDGAGAVVLTAGERSERGALLGFDLGSDGALADLIMVPSGGSRDRDGDERYMHMRGKAVFVQAVQRMAESSLTALARTGWSVDSVDCLVGHQANVRILRAVAEQLGLPAEKAFTDLDKYGNTAGASIPIALADAAAAGVIAPGDRVLLTAFGGGATWGAVALEWPDVTPG